MNKVYRNVWNENTQTWVAASELANSKTKSNTVCELPLVKHVLNIFGLKKIVSLTLTTLALQLQAVSPAYAANLAITGTTNASTNGTGVSYASGSHGSIALAGDDDFCGADKVNGRRNITTGGISAMEEYLRFAQNRSFNGRNPYGTSNGQQVWTGDGATGGNTSGSSGYMGTPTGGDINKLPVAYGVYSFASGCGSYATGNYSTAFGNNATATAGGAQAFGVAALASGATAVAIGVGAQATNTASLALGSVATSDGAGSVAVGFNSAAQQDNTTALGANAIATVEKAVALGSDSLANTNAGIQGYDPAGTNTDAVNQSATWKSTAAAVAIGNANTQITRQITGLAAGTADTDAVNVAQLKNLASSTSTGLSNLFTAINGNLNGLNNNVANLQKDALQWNSTAYDASHGTANAQKITNVAIGDTGEYSTDAVNGGQLYSLSSSTISSLNNLSTTFSDNLSTGLSTANSRIDIVSQSTATLAGNLSTAINSISTLQKDALQWNGTAYDASHGTANPQKITNVAAGQIGENSTDAVNAGQLFSLSSSTSTRLDSLSTTLHNAGDLSNVNNNISSLTNSISNLQKDALQWNGNAYDASHGTANAQRITNVAAGQIGENSTDAVNAGQLFSLSSSTSTRLDSLSTTLHNAGDLNNVNNNISSLTNSISNLQKDALQWNGNAYDASHGTANPQKITNVAAGQIGENSTDAVNAGQLFSVSTSTAASLSTLSSTLNQAGDLSNVNNNISSLTNSISNLQKDALQWNGTAYDASHGTANAQRITNVAAGQIGENSTDAVNAGQLFSLSSSTSTRLDSLSTTLHNAGDLNNVNNNISSLTNSISNLQKDALQWNGTAYDASHGTANAQRITNVAAGQIGENSTDAVNAGQLFSLSSSTSTRLDSLSTTLHNAGDLSNVNNNISSLTNSISNLQKDALQWNGTAYDASHGTANAQKITNVAIGDTGEYSTDAVNGGQLYSLSSSTISSLNNLSTTFSDNLSTGLSTANSRIDIVSQSTATLAGNLSTAINSISTLQKDALQWNGTAYDASHGTANPQKITNVAAGQIGENSTDAVNAGQLFSLSSSTSTRLDSLSTTLHNAGDLSNVNNNISSLTNSISNLQKDALQWNGNAYDASHGTANAQRITNVAAGQIGENSTDAVNAGQLFSLSSSTSTRLDSLSTTLHNAGDLNNVNNNISSLTNSISNLQKDALQWNGNAYDASHGTANAQRITNVAAGQIGENSTDAVNAGQLYSLSSSTISSLNNLSTTFSDNLSTGLSTANSRIDIVSQSTATLAGNLSTAINSISTLQKDALQWNGTAYDASHGTANPQKITNVAAGQIGENSTDAVNAGQLYSISSSIFSSVSSSVENVVNENKINMDAVNRDLKTAQSAIQTAQNDIQTSKKLIEELQKNAVHFDDDDAGSPSPFGLTRDTSNERTISNIANGRVDATSNQAVNGRQLYALSTSTSTSLSSLQEQLNLASGNIPAGLSTSLSALQTDALQWNGNAYDASHHSGSSQKITNLAIGDIGEHSTDAVNGSQLWQMKNDFKQDLQNLSDSFDNKLAQNNSGSTAAINAATDKANQALAKADSLSTSTAKTLSKVASSLGGNASYNAETGNFTAPSYSSTAADGTALTANNVGDALTNLYNGGSKYAKVNSTLSVASASGNNAIAVGGAAVASGNAAVAIGAEAKASAADGVAIGNHASVTQSGGIALGANSVANTAGGIMGYIPASATAQQARAIQATTSTEAAVSVGDASRGIYRQITGVAAGTEDTDAVNVAQLKGVNARIENINQYVNNVNDRIQHVERRAYSGTALAMALSGAYLPQLNAGEQTVGVGMGSYHGYTAVGINYKATNNSGKFSWGAGVSTTGHETGFNAGVGYKW
jgi:autotransporter adhesin